MSPTVPYICDDARDIIFSFMSPFYLRHLSRAHYETFIDSLSAPIVYRYLSKSEGLFASILAMTDLERLWSSRTVSSVRSSHLATISPRAFMVLIDNIRPYYYDYIPNGLTYVEKAKIFSDANIDMSPSVYISLLTDMGKDPLKIREVGLLSMVIDERPDLIPLLPKPTHGYWYNTIDSFATDMATEFDLIKGPVVLEDYEDVQNRCRSSFEDDYIEGLAASVIETKTDMGFRNAVAVTLQHLARRR